MNKAYSLASEFMRKYPGTVAWRIKQHCKVIEKNLIPGEEVVYAFAGQKNDNPLDIVTSCVVAITNKRIVIGQKRVLFGYFFYSITPDLYNDSTIDAGFLWGKVVIDTVKEVVTLSNITKKALPEIVKMITENMISLKKELYSKSE